MLNFAPPRAQTSHCDVPALLARVKRGDRAALEWLYRREAGAVYRYALALCGNEAWAADATHDAFINFAQQPAAFDVTRGSLGAYLAGAARHTLLALWRQARSEVVHDDADAAEDEGAQADRCANACGSDHAAANPERLLVQAQNTQALWQALAALPFIHREAVVLVDLQERPYLEAARIAGVELNTLRTRLHRARLRLAAMLGAGASP